MKDTRETDSAGRQKVSCQECGAMMFQKGLGPHRHKKHNIGQAKPAGHLHPAKASHPSAAEHLPPKEHKKPSKWTAEERTRIVSEFVLSRIENPLEDTRKLFRKAVHKNTAQVGGRPTIGSSIRDEIYNQWKDLIDNFKVEVPLVIERTLPPPPPDVQAVLDTVGLPVLFAAVGKRIGEALEKGAFPSWVTAPPKAKYVQPVETTRKTRVAIVGLLADQQHAVRDSFGGDLELIFVDKERSAKSIPCTTDYAVVQRHTPHSWFKAAQDAVGHENVRFASGGISSVLAHLKDINDKVSGKTVDATAAVTA